MMMKSSTLKWLLMVLSIALGGVSAWLLNQYLNDKTNEIEIRSRLNQITLLVAAKNLSRDTILDESDYKAQLFPEKWAPDDAISFEHSDAVVGKRLTTDVRAGQPLMYFFLQEPEADGLSTRLEPGLKAISVTLDPSITASGFVRAGDRIDLFVSLDYQGRRITVPLIQSVEVLATGNLAEVGLGNEPSNTSVDANITLAISETDAIKVIAAREAGSISAVLSSNHQVPARPSHASSVGDLAALLGLPEQQTIRVAPIIYGDRLSPDREDSEVEVFTQGNK